ncbi:MAG: helicase [Deltaproteobacteria bacterium]|nr:helicase [Deltaproteobacteria bacterium]
MQIPENKITEIKNAADIVDIISETVDLKLAGKDYIGSCPFHDEKTPSFTVSCVKQMYYCFGCGTGGDVIEFLVKKNNISFLDAAKQLADRYGIQLPENQTMTTQHKTPQPPKSTTSKVASKHIPTSNLKQPAPPPELWQEKASAFAGWAHEKLLGNPAQLKILANRGIKRETVKHFHLGYNPGQEGNDLFRPRESWGLATEMKENRKKKLWLPVGLVIPMFSGDHVHRLRIRRPDGSKPSYYVIPGSSMATWVMQTSNKVYIIVESELDGILLWQEARYITGIIPTGSSSTHPDQLTTKLLNTAALILNAMDYDTAGTKALKWWDETFLNSERWPVPTGKDPGEAFQFGVDLREWITSGFPPMWQNGRFSLNCNKKKVLWTPPKTRQRSLKVIKTSHRVIQEACL